MRALVVTVVLAVSSQAAADKPGPTAKDLVDWIDKKCAAINSLEMELVSELEISDATMKSITRFVSVAQVARKDGNWRVRRETRQKTNQACRGPKCVFPPAPPDQTTIEIGDRARVTAYVKGEKPKQRAVTATDATNPLMFASTIRAAAASPNAVLERLPDTRTGGRKVHVLVLSDAKAKTQYQIATDTGLLVKAMTTVAGGPYKVETTTVTRRAEVDKAVPDRTFDPPNRASE